MSTPRRPTAPRTDKPRLAALIVVALLGLPLVLVGCGAGTAAQVGAAPTRDWPSEIACPPTLAADCEGKRLTLFSTINEPQGTTYGIASSNDDTFLVCPWPAGAPAFTCERVPETGARVVGEAAIYRVDD